MHWRASQFILDYISYLCFASLAGVLFTTNSQIGPNLMKTFETVYGKLPPPPPQLVWNHHYHLPLHLHLQYLLQIFLLRINAGCLSVVAVASSPLLSAAGLAARLLPRLHLYLMEITAISASWTSMNLHMMCYESPGKKNLKLKHICCIFLYIFVLYSL